MVTYYNEKDLVSFGKYLLSDERNSKITGDRSEVYHADIENWKYELGLTKSKNYLKTLGVDLTKVYFVQSPNFYFKDNEVSYTDPGVGSLCFSLAEYRNITSPAMQELCNASSKIFLFSGDGDPIKKDSFGVVKSLRGFFHVPEYRYVILQDPNIEAWSAEDVQDKINETCEENGWRRMDRNYLIGDFNQTTKAKFEIIGAGRT